MENKDNTVEVKADLDDLLFVFGSALRYGLGRRTYATSLISSVLLDNLTLLNEKWTVNLLRDINGYELSRQGGHPKDDDCDFESWMELKRRLLVLYMERGYTHPME